MPSYEFLCKGCGHTFSVTTSWSQKSKTQCPACQGQELKELFGNYRIMSGNSLAMGSTGGGGCGSVG